jgi:hypothetical protein
MAEIPVFGSDRPAICSDEDYDYLSRFKWYADEDKGPYRLIGYGRLPMGTEVLLLHPEKPPPGHGPYWLVVQGQA